MLRSFFLFAATALMVSTTQAFIPSVPHQQPRHHQRATHLASAVTDQHVAPTIVHETFILPMGDDSRLKIRFRPDTFKDLALKVNALLASFRAIKAHNAAEDKKGPPPMEPSLMFVIQDFETHLEMECNPNIYPDAFHATVFVKAKNEVMEVSSQCQLSALVDALKLYKQTYKIEIDPNAAK